MIESLQLLLITTVIMMIIITRMTMIGKGSRNDFWCEAQSKTPSGFQLCGLKGQIIFLFFLEVN